MRLSYYSVRQSHNPKLKFVDKFTHFILDIGNLSTNSLISTNFSRKICCPLLTSLVSGSPIIQDGKPQGAVTHVPQNDPTRGYGIFTPNMLAEIKKSKLQLTGC